jgi:hypothetical protein
MRPGFPASVYASGQDRSGNATPASRVRKRENFVQGWSCDSVVAEVQTTGPRIGRTVYPSEQTEIWKQFNEHYLFAARVFVSDYVGLPGVISILAWFCRSVLIGQSSCRSELGI